MEKQPFKEIQLEIERYVRDTFPRKAGKMAVDHIRENFRREGYVDGGLHKWWDPVRKRKKKGKTAGQSHGNPHQEDGNRPPEEELLMERAGTHSTHRIHHPHAPKTIHRTQPGTDRKPVRDGR